MSIKNQTPNWIDEKTAANMLGYAPRTLRNKVKFGSMPVGWFSMGTKATKYNKVDIEKIIASQANLVR